MLAVVWLFALCSMTLAKASHLISQFVLTIVVLLVLSALLGSIGGMVSHDQTPPMQVIFVLRSGALRQLGNKRRPN